MNELEQTTFGKQTILQEIETVKQKNPQGWHGYFNNLWTYLPNHLYPDNGPRRNLLKSSGAYGITKRQWYQLNDPGSYSDMEHRSKIYLDQTPEEYFNAIDQTLKEHKVSEEQIIALTDPKEGDLKALYELLIPVYVDLRLQGYNHYDLTG